jgi:predicted dehydrogenase
MREYRVGIVGCGRMAGSIDDEVIGYDACILPYSHAAAYSAIGRTHLVAAADIDPNKLMTFCKRWKVSSQYSDYREMIEREQLDVLSVTTPATARHEIVTFAAKKGIKGIYCEKAMCCSMSQADDIVESCRSNDVKLNVGTLRRFHPGYQMMRELVGSGKMGEPKVVIAYSAGQLMHTHSHTVDTVRFLLGDPTLNYVQGSISGAEHDEAKGMLDRDPSLVMGYASLAEDKHAFFVPSPGLYEFEVDCTGGVVRVLDNGIEFRMRVLKGPTDQWGLHVPANFPSFERVSPTVRCIGDLINAMEKDSDTKCSPSVGRDGMELCLGMALSHIGGGAKVSPAIMERHFYIPSH